MFPGRRGLMNMTDDPPGEGKVKRPGKQGQGRQVVNLNRKCCDGRHRQHQLGKQGLSTLRLTKRSPCTGQTHADLRIRGPLARVKRAQRAPPAVRTPFCAIRGRNDLMA